MCTIDDFDGEFNNAVTKHDKNQEYKTCNKCKEELPVIVLRNKDPYCTSCFLIGTNHKFKAQLGKSKLLRPSDKVLVCHKLGHPSTTLLHFLRMGLDLNTPKKIRFEPVILFVDDLQKLNNDERVNVLTKVSTHIKSFGFKANIISFAEYMSNDEEIESLIFNEVTEMKNSSIIFQKPTIKRMSNTDKNDLKNIQMRQLLIKLAKYFHCKFVFTPEISVDVSAQLLTNVSLGRGSNLTYDIGFCDNRDGDVKILRPLRIFDMKELAFYNKLNNLEPISVQQIDNSPYSSVQDLMLKFVKDIQIDFPATVTTVLKTGDKIATNVTGQTCNLCKGIVNLAQPKLCSEESTAFSKLVSTEIPNYSLSRQDKYRELLDKFIHVTNKDTSPCYSCSKLVDHLANT